MKLKICGITNLNDLKLCHQYNCDYIGFNFYKKSKRYIETKKYLEISKGLDISKNVGIIVNESISSVMKIINDTHIEIIQLHSDEDNSYIDKIRKNTNIKIIKVFRIKNNLTEAFFNIEIKPLIDNETIDYFLLDKYKSNSYGGTGESFNWKNLKTIIPKKYLREKLFFSGGITVKNYLDAIKINPYCIDIASGSEEKPGKKSEQKIKYFSEFKNKIPY